MAKKGTAAPTQGPPQVPPEQGIHIIKVQIGRAKELLSSLPVSSNDYEKWQILTKNFLEKAFGANSPNVSSVMDAGEAWSFPMYADEVWWENHRASSLETQIQILAGLVELLQTEIQLSKEQAPAAGKGTGTIPMKQPVFWRSYIKR